MPARGLPAAGRWATVRGVLDTGRLLSALDGASKLLRIGPALPDGPLDPDGETTWHDVFEDVLRGGLVLAVAALDDFMKSLVVAGVAARARTGKPGEYFLQTVLPDLLKQQPDTVARAVTGAGSDLEATLGRYYGRTTFQSPEAVERALGTFLGVPGPASIWDTADKRLTGGGSKDRLAAAVGRRNRIAHGEDTDAISPADLSAVLELVGEIAVAAAEAVVRAGLKVITIPMEVPDPAIVVLLADGPAPDGRGGYWTGMTPGQLVDSARQHWRISPQRVAGWAEPGSEAPKYLVAMHRGAVVGLWTINHDGWAQRPHDGRWSMDLTSAPGRLRTALLGNPLRDPHGGSVVRGYGSPVLFYPRGHAAFQ